MPLLLRILLVTTSLLLALGANAQGSGAELATKPWMNKALTPDQRADLAAAQLTRAEKIQLVHGIGWGPLREGAPVPADNNGGAGEVPGIPRLGIPSLQQALTDYSSSRCCALRLSA